jgi:oligosaccharide repeat unit polymerase
MRSYRIKSASDQRPWLLNPAIIFYFTWLGVWFLYSLRLSSLLLFPFSTVIGVEVPVLVAFLPLYLLTYFLPDSLYSVLPKWNEADAGKVLDDRLIFWFKVWVAVTLVEIVASGGVPIVWNLMGSSKTYFDFGIPTLHGLMNGLILALCITRFSTGIRFGRRKDMIYPVILLVWTFIVVTRQELMVMVLEIAVLYLSFRKLQVKRVLWLLAIVLLIIVSFGVAGDVRSGGASFATLAQPTARYPEWLPSGFLWVYMYATTPLNNLINTYKHVSPLNDITLPNTLALLTPSALRGLTGGHTRAEAFGGDLITQAFNVSTAFVGPVQDFGLWGMMGFSSAIAFATGLFWRKDRLRDIIVYSVLAQCLILSVFFDHFLYLPIVSQIAWIYAFFRGTGGDVQMSPQVEISFQKSKRSSRSTVSA